MEAKSTSREEKTPEGPSTEESSRYPPSGSVTPKAIIVRRRSRTEVISTNADVAKDLTEGNSTEPGKSDYSTKDNSKLRALSLARGLYTSGSREDLISRLEHSIFDYEHFNTDELSEKLKLRQFPGYNTGSKELKIKRLLLNDEKNSDDTNPDECRLYMRLCILEDLIADFSYHRDYVSTNHKSWNTERLTNLLKERKLSQHGDKATLVARLREDECKKAAEKAEKKREEHMSMKVDL